MEKVSVVDDVIVTGDCYNSEGEGEYIPVSQYKYSNIIIKEGIGSDESLNYWYLKHINNQVRSSQI